MVQSSQVKREAFIELVKDIALSGYSQPFPIDEERVYEQRR